MVLVRPWLATMTISYDKRVRLTSESLSSFLAHHVICSTPCDTIAMMTSLQTRLIGLPDLDFQPPKL
jgi:hypothetical protein